MATQHTEDQQEQEHEPQQAASSSSRAETLVPVLLISGLAVVVLIILQQLGVMEASVTGGINLGLINMQFRGGGVFAAFITIALLAAIAWRKLPP